jgi:2'-5' RNA ligase
MIAVTSLLDPEHTVLVNDVIDALQQKFGLSTVKMTPYPHVTWFTAEINDLTNLKEILYEFAEQSHPFPINTTGLGVFPGSAPVIYIPVLRTNPVNQYHAQLFRKATALCQEMNPYYNPKAWMPHITLAVGDTTPGILGSVLEFLNERTFNWEINIDNLAILSKHQDKYLKEEVFMLNTALAEN